LVESPADSSLTTCVLGPTSSIRVLQSLFECPDLDDNVNLLKTKFDPGRRNSMTIEMEINAETGLPKQVHALFVQFFEQSNFPVESADGLKQLLSDHRDTFASSSSDLGYCSIVKHNVNTWDVQPIRQSPMKPPLAARETEDEILNDMLEWSHEAQIAFEALKEALIEATSLAFSIPNMLCILDNEASEVAVGAVLSQK